MDILAVPIRKLRPDAIIPSYHYADDAGFDLHVVEDVVIPAWSAKILPTGLAIALPAGYELQIRLRSSVALRTPLVIPNAPATVDAGYRGELGIIIRNLSDTVYAVKKGERLAQGVVAKIFVARFEERACLPPSERGAQGYGSSGKD